VNTDLLNPKYAAEGERASEIAKHISMFVLACFLLELSMALLAFGFSFFGHVWKLFDLVVVFGSLVLELASEHQAQAFFWSGLLVTLRFWKFFAFGFDIMLLRHEVRVMEDERVKREGKQPASLAVESEARIEV